MRPAISSVSVKGLSHFIHKLLWAAVFAVIAASGLHAQSAPDWQTQSIYQILTDRFYDGDPSNNNADGNFSATSGTGVHGGDFKGAELKLDYIKSLGATAVWISPIVVNANGEYHGYAGRDFYNIDPHWGTLSNLQSFVASAHARGILVILDIIDNHGGNLIDSADSGYSTFKAPPAFYNLRYHTAAKQFAFPFNTNAANPALSNLFHCQGSIGDYNNQTQVELGELSGLDDFRTESPYIRTNLAAVYSYWIAQGGFDGYRIDTVKHCEMGFWQDWCPRVHAFAATNDRPNFFMFGEILDGSDTKVGSYTGTQGGGSYKLDSALDYPLYFKINSVFATATGNTKQIEDRYAALAANYDPFSQPRLVTFLDNHDQQRFLSSANANNNTNRLAVALAFLYTSRGIPCLYYGTEQAFNGTSDPNNREDMFDGQFEQGPSLGDNFNETHPLFQWVTRLNNFRRLYPSLSLGSHVNLWNTPGGPGLFAYARRLGTQEVFVVFNTAASTQTLTNRSTIYPEGTKLVNLLNTNEVITVGAGPLTPLVSVPATTAKIFIDQAQMLPLDPVVTSVSPAHDATIVPAASPLIVKFSQPMDTNSVMAAFSTKPATTGSFTWAATADAFTYTPAGAWPGTTTVAVRIGDTAFDASTSNTFHAPFESRFTTAIASDLVPPTVHIQSPADGSIANGSINVAGSATDNTSVQKVEIQIDGGAWITASGTVAWNLSLNTGNYPNGTHTLVARATDAGGNTGTNAIGLRFVNVPGSYAASIAGGNANTITNCANVIFIKDQAYVNGSFGYVGGTTGNVTITVSNICPAEQLLYQRERFSSSSGGFRYLFDCPPGVYETTLFEAETYWSAVGQRIFNIYIEGQQVATNLDILAVAGGKALPLTLVFTNAVADGQLELLLTPVVDNARISGIQVRKIGDIYSDNDGIPDWWRLAYFNHALGQADDLSRAGDDADGDGVSNLAEFLAGTDPLNNASAFRISAFLQLGETNRLVWPTVSNRNYQVEVRDSFDASNSWNDVGTPLPGSGGSVTQDVTSTNSLMQFFRVRSP